MALNFSHRPLFPAHLSEENLVSPMKIANGYLVEGIPERNADGFPKPWCSNREFENCFDYGKDTVDRCGSQDSTSVDILDLLPSDPFGMDISSTFTAITGWLEDLEVDYTRYGRNEIGIDDGNYQLFAGLNFIWNNAMRFQEFSGSGGFNNDLGSLCGFGGACDLGLDYGSCHGALVSSSSACEVLSFENASVDEVDGGYDSYDSENGINEGDEALHPAFNYSLCYLGVKDLLSVSMTCKSLQSAVHCDPLLWKHIHIEQPLNERITDEILLQLTDRAQGTLYCLSLVECSRITDEGLKRVLQSNPKVVKLSVPGCTRITIEGVLSSIRDLKSTGTFGLKNLSIGGLYGVTKEHFDELMCLLGISGSVKQSAQKPHYYNRGNLYLSCDEDRPIDIEMCPRCQNFRLVYDCPAEGCKGNGHDDLHACRACTLCIQRCVQCGRCINDSEYEETFCLEFLCSECLKQVSKCLGRRVGTTTPSEPPPCRESSGLVIHG